MEMLRDRSEPFWMKGSDFNQSYTLTLLYRDFPFHNTVKTNLVEKVDLVSTPGIAPSCHVININQTGLDLHFEFSKGPKNPQELYGPWVFEVYTRV